MLPRSRKLHKDDFKKKIGKKTAYSGRFLSISISKCLPAKEPRVAVVVPGALSKNKPLRNTLKRRLYSIFESNFKTLSGMDIMIYPKKEALTQKSSVLKEDLDSVLKKL